MKGIQAIEKERDRLNEEQLTLTKTIEDTLDDVKVKKTEIYELKKSVTERDNRLRMQQNLFDAVRSDRNALQKTLQESTAEAGELKKKVKITLHQIEQLKEDISMKEQQLIKEENVFRKVLKEKENLRLINTNTNYYICRFK